MMRTRAGFTMLEVAIAAAIGSMLLLLLYNGFDQITRSRNDILSRVNYITTMPLISGQLYRDITGLYVPEPAIADLFKGEDEEGKTKVDAASAFELSRQEQQLSLLSGITVNPLTLENDPNRVRFVYQVVNDEDTGYASLYRYQSSDLTKGSQQMTKDGTGVAMLAGITDIQLKLFVPKEQEEEQQNQQNQQQQGQQQQEQKGQQQQQEAQQRQEQKEPIEYEEVESWPQQTEEGKPKHLLPAYCQLYIAGQDAYDLPYEVTYEFPVHAYDGIAATYQSYAEQAKQQQQRQGQQQGQQQGQGGQQGQQQKQSGQKQSPQGQGGKTQQGQQQGGQQQTTVRRMYITPSQQEVIVTQPSQEAQHAQAG